MTETLNQHNQRIRLLYEEGPVLEPETDYEVRDDPLGVVALPVYDYKDVCCVYTDDGPELITGTLRVWVPLVEREIIGQGFKDHMIREVTTCLRTCHQVGLVILPRRGDYNIGAVAFPVEPS